MTLPTYVGAGAIASGTGALTPGMPSHQADDILLLVVNNAIAAVTDATLSSAQGFTAVTGASGNSGNFGGVRSHATLFWKRATSGAEPAPTVADNGDFNAARVYSFRGCVTTGNFWDVISTTGDNDGNTGFSVAGATTTGADRLVVIIGTAFTGGASSLASWTNTDLANIVERDDSSITIGSDFVHLALTTGEKAVAASYGATTATWTGAAYRATFAITIALKPAVGFLPTLAGGTTLDAMRAGSFVPMYTVAIEGYSALLTDGDPALAVDAWSSQVGNCFYATAQDGLFVDRQHSQSLEPFNPFTMGGQCTLHVAATNETFRRETHRRGLGMQTELVGTIDRDATTINVKSTTGWPSSGELYIGTECIGYAGTTATSFTGCTRGKYAPFPEPSSPTSAALGAGFAQHHRDGLNAYQSRIPVIVSSQPRRFIGKWCAVYVHKLEGGVLNDITDALCVYAGRIESISVDAVTKAVVVELKHVLDCIAESPVLSGDQWSGEIQNLIRLDTGMRFYLKDSQLTLAVPPTLAEKTADELTVVASGATGANQINAGFYTVMDIITKLNVWWQSELQAGRIFGQYSIGMYEPVDADRSLFIVWIHDTTGLKHVGFQFGMPSPVRTRLGFDENGSPPTLGPSTANNWGLSVTSPQGTFAGDTFHHYIGQHPYKRMVAFENGQALQARVQNSKGQLFDNFAWLPSNVKPPPNMLVGEYGIFVVDDRFLMVASWVVIGDLVQLSNLRLMPEQFGLNGVQEMGWFALPSKSFTPDITPIKQIAVLEMRVDQALPAFLLSTGTPNYSDPDHDKLPFGIGLAIPRPLARTQLLASVESLPEASASIVIVIDKPTQFADLLAGDLMLRRASFRWKQGEVSLTAWKTPTASQVVAAIDDSNKAAPAGNDDHHATSTTENGSWAKPIVKIQFNRNVNTGTSDDDYRNVILVQDAAAIDDSGGAGGLATIKARNTYGAYQQTGAGIDALAPGYVAQMPIFSRPARMATRSIAPELFEELSIGDVVDFSDMTAIDPETGELGIQERHAIVIGHRYAPGGAMPGRDEPGDMAGEIDLFMFDVERWAEYVPCAQIDDTAAGNGYNGSNRFRCYAHAHSESTEAVDASRFAAGDAIRIVEIDPADPAAPITWDRIVDSVSSNDILITVALSSPSWDGTKRYRIIYDDYADAVTAQRRKSFQADDTDALVQNLRAPYEYGIGGSVAPVTLAGGGDMVELPPNLAYGDGRGRDTGHETALIRLVNNLHDYGTSHQMPMLSASVIGSGGGGGFGTHTWLMVMCKPIYLGEVILLNDVVRYLNVAPYSRSTDGTDAYTRITLAQRPPIGESFFDVDRGPAGTFADWTFITNSTSFAHGTTGPLDCRMKNNDGSAWLIVEINAKCETWGVSRCWEGPREY